MLRSYFENIGEVDIILITGATGRVGNVLVRQLVSQGESVRAFINNTANEHSLDGVSGIERIYGNLLDLPSLERAFVGVKKVYHLASMITILPDNKKKVKETNVIGTKNIIFMCQKFGVEKLIYMSSIHAFQDIKNHQQEINEDILICPKNAIGYYGKSKAEATLAVLEAVKDGLQAVIVMPTGIIGPYDPHNSLMGRTLRMLRSGMPFAVGKYDFVDVRDVVFGTILADKKGRIGHHYILNGTNISIKDLKKLIDRQYQRKEIAVSVPKFLVNLGVPIANLWYILTKKIPLLTSESIHILFSNSNISGAKARQELGYKPREISESIKDYFEWYDENRNI